MSYFHFRGFLTSVTLTFDLDPPKTILHCPGTGCIYWPSLVLIGSIVFELPRKRQTNRQTDRQTDKQTDQHTWKNLRFLPSNNTAESLENCFKKKVKKWTFFRRAPLLKPYSGGFAKGGGAPPRFVENF